ncbi:hypothetical protein PGT21_005629 [Puccinia graminis f. sp. tritici]|uniref:Uncharacterized protein n=1 Tax=Puccinia graminis f. sp. tritici TaxID=56615 RepID=A0A5B0QM71_PUCGR|nr:hypothetical protein PGT21_005629 [Puccinia graminis f. sp. tritici]
MAQISQQEWLALGMKGLHSRDGHQECYHNESAGELHFNDSNRSSSKDTNLHVTISRPRHMATTGN